jgi:DNA-binding transcriptional ArsR family regulator
MARMKVSAYVEGLDPVLLHGVRLFIVTLLVEMRWREYVVIRDALGLTAEELSSQLAKLRRAGLVETRRQGRRTSVRLTPLGCERLTDHLAALQAIVRKAGEILAFVSAASSGERLSR